MKILLTVNHTNEKPLVRRMPILDIIKTGGVLSVDNSSYEICSSLFPAKNVAVNFYKIEQVGIKFNRSEPPSFPFVFFSIYYDIEFERQEEIDAFFKETEVQISTTKEVYSIPFDLIEKSDCLELEEDNIKLIERCYVSDKRIVIAYPKEITKKLFHSPISPRCKELSQY